MKKIINLFLVISLIFGLAACGDKTAGLSDKLHEQLDLGQKYLAEADYENALIAFEKAIEIDDKSVEAYLGAADAYIGLNDFENAAGVVSKAMEVNTDEAQNKAIIEKMDEINTISIFGSPMVQNIGYKLGDENRVNELYMQTDKSTYSIGEDVIFDIQYDMTMTGDYHPRLVVVFTMEGEVIYSVEWQGIFYPYKGREISTFKVLGPDTGVCQAYVYSADFTEGDNVVDTFTYNPPLYGCEFTIN